MKHYILVKFKEEIDAEALLEPVNGLYLKLFML